MARRKQLSQRQLAVLEDLFNSDLDERSVLEKHRVRRSTYNRWLDDEVFAERFRQHINGLNRQHELLIAKFGGVAAVKLVKLTASAKEETARKACLDVMLTLKKLCETVQATRPSACREAGQVAQLSPETASRLLAALAEKKGEKI